MGNINITPAGLTGGRKYLNKKRPTKRRRPIKRRTPTKKTNYSLFTDKSAKALF